MRNLIIVGVIMMMVLNIVVYLNHDKIRLLRMAHNVKDKIPQELPELPQFTPIQEPPKPEKYDVSPLPIEYINYTEICALMKKWSEEAPEITEYGEYGKTPSGKPHTYLRIGTQGKPKVLLHASIHGNERLSTAATMWMMQKMLHDYGRDDEITWLVENRDVWWIPVFSPETHLRSRHVEGRDPNRDYPYPGRRSHTPTHPVQAIIDLHEKEGFTGVISGHTTGNVYFWPSLGPREDQDIHKKLAGEMGDRSGYRASRISSSPNGYDVDWYYWQGAVAILTEFGSGGHNQPTSAIEPHGKKNYPAYMHFVKEAPELSEKLSPPSNRWINTGDKPLITIIEE